MRLIAINQFDSPNLILKYSIKSACSNAQWTLFIITLIIKLLLIESLFKSFFICLFILFIYYIQ